jgi:hypothetical protein
VEAEYELSVIPGICVKEAMMIFCLEDTRCMFPSTLMFYLKDSFLGKLIHPTSFEQCLLILKAGYACSQLVRLRPLFPLHGPHPSVASASTNVNATSFSKSFTRSPTRLSHPQVVYRLKLLDTVSDHVRSTIYGRRRPSSLSQTTQTFPSG